VALRLLIDESADSRTLRRLLAAEGHEAVTAADAGLLGARDSAIFAYTRAHNLVTLTRNPADFRELHQGEPQHAGIFLIYKDNDPTRDMTDADIVRAIANLISAGVPIEGEVHTLNHWRY